MPAIRPPIERTVRSSGALYRRRPPSTSTQRPDT